MSFPSSIPSPIIVAHSHFMKAEGEVDANNVSGALDYYKRAFDIFSAELQQSSHLPDIFIDLKSPNTNKFTKTALFRYLKAICTRIQS